ncbi:hypothetical protein CCP2SC5_450004 [Azospirillaceae bacterium]
MNNSSPPHTHNSQRNGAKTQTLDSVARGGKKAVGALANRARARL